MKLRKKVIFPLSAFHGNGPNGSIYHAYNSYDMYIVDEEYQQSRRFKIHTVVGT